jgi:hypothetical protein
VGTGAVVREAVVLRGATVAAGAVIEKGIVAPVRSEVVI